MIKKKKNLSEKKSVQSPLEFLLEHTRYHNTSAYHLLSLSLSTKCGGGYEKIINVPDGLKAQGRTGGYTRALTEKASPPRLERRKEYSHVCSYFARTCLQETVHSAAGPTNHWTTAYHRAQRTESVIDSPDTTGESSINSDWLIPQSYDVARITYASSLSLLVYSV